MEFYNYPETKIDIFKPYDNNYFIKAAEFSYLCTYEELMRIDRWNDFTDAYVLIIYKRYAVIEAGNIVYHNSKFADGHVAEGRHGENGFVIISNISHKYFIHSWNKELESYEIRSDEKYNSALNPMIFASAEDAVTMALELSKSNQGTYVVAQWFDECDRH